MLKWLDCEVPNINKKGVKVSALDKQEGGNHYKDLKIQPVEYITANNIPFIEGCIIKYATRHNSKNGAQDVKKIIHFCELLLQLKYGGDNGSN